MSGTKPNQTPQRDNAQKLTPEQTAALGRFLFAAFTTSASPADFSRRIDVRDTECGPVAAVVRTVLPNQAGVTISGTFVSHKGSNVSWPWVVAFPRNRRGVLTSGISCFKAELNMGKVDKVRLFLAITNYCELRQLVPSGTFERCVTASATVAAGSPERLRAHATWSEWCRDVAARLGYDDELTVRPLLGLENVDSAAAAGVAELAA